MNTFPAANLERRLRLIAFTTIVLCLVEVVPSALAQGPGNIVGHIDRVTFDGTDGVITGWACQQGRPESITVQVLADGELLVAGKADLENEPGVNQACRAQGGRHRFQITLPNKPFADGQERILSVRGIRAAGNVENALITGSGTTRFRLPTAVPGVAGSYTSSSTYPRVFNTPYELEDLATRIKTPGAYSSERFKQLATQVGRDLDSGKEWAAAYSGCNSDTYNYAFSYEPQTIEHEDHSIRIRADMKLPPNAKPPGGAAVVAARDALYAAMVKAGATLPAGGPAPERAAALAKQILLGWSSRGFRDNQGRFLNSPKQFCDADGKFVEGAFAGAGLVVARGVLYSVQTRDLLTYLGDLGEAESKQVTAFHSAMFDLILNALNYNFVEQRAWDCDHYSNHAANLLAGLLALARDLDRQKEFEAVANGLDPSIHVSLSWVMFLQRAIYGEHDMPNACYANTGKDGYTSRPFFQTSIVALGEIDDRYRNADPGKGIGYPMFTLERLYDAAEVMHNAGFDAYGYRGAHKQSIEMATAYYACYAKGAGFFEQVTPENSASCPDAEQYYGKIVNGVERMIVIGALRFPDDRAIISVEAAAKKAASSGVFSLDSILFGRWRD